MAMKKISRWLWVGIIIWVAACMPSVKTPVKTVMPTNFVVTSTLVPTQPVTSGLTVEKLQNSAYLAPQYQKTVQLINGEYKNTDANGEYSVTILPQIAIGDLNGDQVDDAAVLLAENDGGTGVFVSLVVFVSDGDQYVQAGSNLIDDRAQIKSLSIMNGEINLEGTIHGINDSMAQPTLNVKQTYRLLEDHLSLIKLSSAEKDGAERSINIDLPVDGSEVSNPIQIKGTMPIAPFENTLSLTVYDLAGNPLFQSPLMVTASNAGGPATFDAPMTLTGITSGSTVRVELSESSMADGSMVASDSVVVKIK